MRKALQLGAADLLNKPFVHDDQFARISSALRIKNYQDELKWRNKLL
jgi:DNA-binding response OmpR family regulator